VLNNPDWLENFPAVTLFAMNRSFLCSFLLALLIAGALTASAQSKPQQTSTTPQTASAPAPAARPADVDTPEHLLAALYDVISGPAGKRDWDRFRSLFYSGARLMPSGKNPQGVLGVRVLTPDEYAIRGQAFFDKEGFFEHSVANRTELWDHIAHVWSTYESRHAKDDTKPFARGINSIQLFSDGKRWWVLSVYWEAEDETHTLPEPYLH
jgi:hypothetical protein